MPQWQYKFVECELRNGQWRASENAAGESSSLQTDFEQLGKHGWELAETLTTPPTDGQLQKCQFVFKREMIHLSAWLGEDEETERLMLESPPSVVDATRALDALHKSSQLLDKPDIAQTSAPAVAALLANPCPGSQMVLVAALQLHPIIRKHAALALAELGDERSVPGLLEVVHSSEDMNELKRSAIGIAKLGDSSALDEVWGSFLSGKPPRWARGALIDGLLTEVPDQTEQYLVRFLNEGDDDLQQEASHWLKRIETPSADAALQEWYAGPGQRWKPRYDI
jgi:hypothetical protein